MLKFRWFLRVPAVALLVLCLWVGVAAAVSLAPDHITLTWTLDPRSTQMITWRTDISITAGQVRYYEIVDASTLPKITIMAAKTSIMESPDGTMNIHSATLTGLTPGRRYSYQVGGGSSWSGIYSFNTAPLKAGPFKFLIFGDSQSLDY